MDAAFIVQQQGKSIGTDIREPLNTITAGGMGHMYLAVVRLQPAGERDTARDGGDAAPEVCRGIFPDPVTVQGRQWHITDIGLRILEPKELYGCQGFPEDYVIGQDAAGKRCPKGEQARFCGNAVCPPIAAALIQASLPELCQEVDSADMHPAA